MDIIVTTPKGQMANAAQEAADCIANGGGEYFRHFADHCRPNIEPGERVFYVENGYLRGFAVVSRAEWSSAETCQATGRQWNSGFYVYMDAASWQWITPIAMIGFQGYQYAKTEIDKSGLAQIHIRGRWQYLRLAGDWRDPRPEVTA